MKNNFMKFLSLAACTLFSNNIESMNNSDFLEGFGEQSNPIEVSFVDRKTVNDKQNQTNKKAQGLINCYKDMFQNMPTNDDAQDLAVQRLFQINRLWCEVSQDQRNQFAIEAEWLVTKFYPETKDLFYQQMGTDEELTNDNLNLYEIICNCQLRMNQIIQEQENSETVVIDNIAELVVLNNTIKRIDKLKYELRLVDKEFRKQGGLNKGKRWLINEIDNSNDVVIYLLAKKRYLYSIIHFEVDNELNSKHFMQRYRFIKEEIRSLQKRGIPNNYETAPSIQFMVLQHLLNLYEECRSKVIKMLKGHSTGAQITGLGLKIQKLKRMGISENRYDHLGIYLQTLMRAHSNSILYGNWFNIIPNTLKGKKLNKRIKWLNEEIQKLERDQACKNNIQLTEVSTFCGKILYMLHDISSTKMSALKYILKDLDKLKTKK